MTDSNMTEVLVAIGRIEEMVKAMSEKLDKLETQTEKKFALIDDQTERQWKKIASIDTELQLIKERQGPTIHWVTWLSAIGALVAVALSVLDRIYAP